MAKSEVRRMQRRSDIHRWLLTVWLILWGCLLSPVSAQKYGRTYKGSIQYRMYRQPSANTTLPTYEFQSTSAYSPASSGSAYAPQVSAPYATRVGSSKPKRAWGDPEDDTGWTPSDGEDWGIGEVAEKAPIGEPWILLLLAMTYIVYKRKVWRLFIRKQ